MPRVVTWEPGMQTLGPAVVAIGVFDGVHLGHQKLLKATVREARRLEAKAVALTFDRDPDQVVTPEAAAPQLLTLEDKCAFIAATGIDTVLVVPFTQQIAGTPAECFLDDVLGTCCDVRAVHVGSDFRFGAKAAGDIDTLYVWGVEHGAEVHPHELVEHDGQPVTSTRIRTLVAHGHVAEAGELLGRPTRVTGSVHEGRGEGRKLGFPTANVVPVEHAALPGDGVYAGRAVLDDGSLWPAAISVGVPPSFPEARDYLEAHLIGFEGDLYGRALTLEFVERLRDQRSFPSLEALVAAIRTDVEKAAEVERAGVSAAATSPEEWEPSLRTFLLWAFNHILPASEIEDDLMEDGTPVVDDPAALRRAQAEVDVSVPERVYERVDEDWTPVTDWRRLSGMFGDAGFTASLVSAPLDAAHIPYAWDPYPPERMPSYRYGYGAVDRPFKLLVPASRLPEAQRLLGVNVPERIAAPPTPPSDPGGAPVPPSPDRASHPARTSAPERDLGSGPIEDTSGPSRRLIVWVAILVFIGFDLMLLAVATDWSF